MIRRTGIRLGFMGVLALVAQVASAMSLTVAPAQHTIEVQAGSTASRALSITNNGEAPLTINTYAWDWWYRDDGGHQFAPPGTFERSGATWVSVMPEMIVVGPGETRQIDVHVSMPPDIEGGYYAVAFVEARPGTPESEGFSMRPGGRIAVPILMEARGTGAHSLSVLDAAVAPPSGSAPLTLSLVSQNMGDTHEFPEFLGAIRSMETESVLARFQGNPKRMLPGQIATIDATWSGTLDPGSYEVLGTLVYGDGRSVPVRESFDVGAPAITSWVP